MAKFLDLTGLTQFKSKIQEWVNGAFVPKTRKVNNKPLSSDITLSASDVGAIPTSQKGSADGVASLDGSGKVPTAQLPSYVDDVIDGYLNGGKFYKEEAHTTEIPGEDGKIYVDEATNKTYRWSGSAFVEISASLALGTTSSTAFAGDKGQAAYDHSQKKSGNPHGVTKSDVGLSNVTNDKQMKGLSSGTTNGHVMAFGADGYTPKDTGFTIQKSVPADAKFTDTIYTHPTAKQLTAGLYKVTTDANGHITAGTAVAKVDITELGIPGQDTTYSAFKGASGSAAGSIGLVPAPQASDTAKYLKGDGTWDAITVPSVSAITNEEINKLFE